MHSLKDELKFLLSGQGMPYEKVSLMVAVVVTVLMTALFGNNFIGEAPVTVVDLDNSRYSRELIGKIDASEYMAVKAVLNVPADPETLFYRDESIAVVYLPQGLEQNLYRTGAPNAVGVFYDNTNTAQTAEIKEAMNEIVGMEKAVAAASTGAATEGGLSLRARNLFNPVTSTANGSTQGFLFFFSSMFFTFATIGMVSRLRLSGKLAKTLRDGTPLDLVVRLLPYGGCLMAAFFLGMTILRFWGDMIISGSLLLFAFVQVFYILALGILCLVFGWTASNPGLAASRMILFVPGGFILGGATGPAAILSPWAWALSHIFPLTWEFHFTRDILARGAGFWDIAQVFGAFLIYIALCCGLLTLLFHKERAKLAARGEEKEEFSPSLAK